MRRLERARRGAAVVCAAALVVGCAGGGAREPGGASGAGGAAPAGVGGATTQGAGGASGGGGTVSSTGGAGGGGAAPTTGSAGDTGGAGEAATVDAAAGTGGGAAGRDAGAAPSADAHAAESGAACSASADPLGTNSARNDAYDCVVLDVSARYGHPDPMMVKAQIAQESSFQVFSISPDSPCGVHAGWTDAESKSFGLIQVTPACGEATAALLPDGHPNLTMDMTSPLWATSVFNPPLNLGEGVQGIADSLVELRKKYPGCTDAQYVLMSAGAFNSGMSAVTGCATFNARAQSYVDAVLSHYAPFAKAAGWPNPY